jgi:hypothetical protein
MWQALGSEGNVEAVFAAVPHGPDPLFGEDFEPRYRELRRQIAPEAKEPG